jgi:magnesium transporter
MKNPLLVPEIRQWITSGNKDAIRELCEELHPTDVAEFLSALEAEEILTVLFQQEGRLRAIIFAHLEHELQAELTGMLSRQQLSELLTSMPNDDRVDLIKSLPDELSERVLPALAAAEREDIRKLASYPERTVGAAMTSDYATLSEDLTVQQAIDRLRQVAPDRETIYYAYVVDAERKLIGLVSLRDLILARPNRKIADIMQTAVISANAEDDQEGAARIIRKYGLIALPVTDSEHKLVGIVTHDDAADIIEQEHQEDVEKLMAIAGGHSEQSYTKKSSLRHFRDRAGWVVGLAILGFVSGAIVASYEDLLIEFAILATFMPMLADTGGNTGSQSATLVVRALAVKEIVTKDLFKVLWKELRVALMMGAVLAGVAVSRVFLFGSDTNMPPGTSLALVSLAVGLALALQVISSMIMGAFTPIAAQKLKLDPAVVASPALTTFVDITGLLIFFSISKAILGVG